LLGEFFDLLGLLVDADREDVTAGCLLHLVAQLTGELIEALDAGAKFTLIFLLKFSCRHVAGGLRLGTGRIRLLSRLWRVWKRPAPLRE
jgi:hypothetical protein